MLHQYHPASTECYTYTLEKFFCGVCIIVSIAEVDCTKYGYQGKYQLCQLILQILCGQSSAKFDLLVVLILILTPSNLLQKFYKQVFDELKGTSIRTDDLLSNTLRTTITCNSCFCSAVREEKLDIVSVPYQGKYQLCQLILQIFCGHSSAKFHLLVVLLLILNPSRMLQKFYKQFLMN